jgi:hypothetical protein
MGSSSARPVEKLIHGSLLLTGSRREPYGIKQRALVDRSRN